MMTAHLDDDLSSRYAAGLAADAEVESVDAHLSVCDDCRVLVAELARTSEERNDEEDPLSGSHIGRYRLAERLGSGATSIVYRAYDPVLDRHVALKLLRDLEGPGMRVQLVAAARAMAQLTHPNVLRVYDAGEDGAEVFVASAVAEGGDLREAMGNGVSPTSLLARLAELANGLAAVHEAGLTHRDIKPDNVLLDSEGRLLLADIGHVVKSGVGTVTPAYLAPEVAKGKYSAKRAISMRWR
mgnify:FL=1|tara:strand:+ start:36027 stop:36749 length:723 start_codon:yes stop_codon:yes gene_type:complete